jgi:EAL domain-containing protein (putative c-di-GMP-specific phosphodiesterase class I)
VHYQPLIRFDDGSLAGAEALVRWLHPVRGLVAPADFIPLAEETGSIDEIGAWVLGEACRQVAAWDAAGIHVPRVSVNLSVHQVNHVDLVPLVASVLDETGIGATRLELEVTESMVMRDVERSSAVLRDLCALGITVALDDFGTGHSSLAKLTELPLHRLKIDRSFIRDVGFHQTGEAIINATVVLARSLGLVTIAEGVETAEQADFLRGAGCDIAQGYLFGRPVPAAEFAAQFSVGVDAA